MEFVDTHCHPHFSDFLPDPGQMINDAKTAGVTKLIAVGTTLADSSRAIDFAQNHAGIWSSAGTHPHEAREFLADKKSPDRLIKLLNKLSIVAVGEIGLDYYKNISPADAQLAALRSQIEATKHLDLPYIFHVRDAWEDFWKLVDDYSGIRGVIHSFSAGPKILKQVVDRGFYVGLNGIMTFTRDESQLEAARQVPLDKLLLETDAPFLAPAPFRGQTCQPKHVVTTAQFLAQLRAEDLAQFARATTDNANKLFTLETK